MKINDQVTRKIIQKHDSCIPHSNHIVFHTCVFVVCKQVDHYGFFFSLQVIIRGVESQAEPAITENTPPVLTTLE